MLYSELKRKEVINQKDCNKLGHVTDIEFDPCTGCIHKIYVSDRSCFIPFIHSTQDYVISYKDIAQIGPDIIMVNLC